MLILRCGVPRTFIDCNRVAAGAVPGVMVDGLTPAVASYISDPADQQLLADLHFRYHQPVAARAYEQGAQVRPRAPALQLRPATPWRSVGIDAIDADIVRALHRVYEPDLYATWPERPQVDLISAGPDGRVLAHAAMIAALHAHYPEIGVEVRDNATYHLHPATMGYHYAARYPGQVLCVEMRRDLLADPFVPFGESPISPDKVARMTTPLLTAVAAALTTGLILVEFMLKTTDRWDIYDDTSFAGQATYPARRNGRDRHRRRRPADRQPRRADVRRRMA